MPRCTDGSAIREVELVDELLTTGQRGQPGGGTINDCLIEVIEFGLPNPPAVDDHEPIQLRAIFNERTRY